MRLVLDTDVVVAALRSPRGASAELFRHAADRRFVPAISVPLLIEYEAVVSRPEHLAAASLDASQVQIVLDGLVALAHRTEVHYRYRPVTNDPSDELVVEAAINSDATAIVTFNRRDYGTGPARFGIGCWLPREALEKLR